MTVTAPFGVEVGESVGDGENVDTEGGVAVGDADAVGMEVGDGAEGAAVVGTTGSGVDVSATSGAAGTVVDTGVGRDGLSWPQATASEIASDQVERTTPRPTVFLDAFGRLTVHHRSETRPPGSIEAVHGRGHSIGQYGGYSL